MTHTPLQRLIFYLDQASTIAFSLQKNTELPVDMAKLYKKLDDLVADLMEYEANLPTNND
jgi:uracil DNA glycosylase